MIVGNFLLKIDNGQVSKIASFYYTVTLLDETCTIPYHWNPDQMHDIRTLGVNRAFGAAIIYSSFYRRNVKFTIVLEHAAGSSVYLMFTPRVVLLRLCYTLT